MSWLDDNSAVTDDSSSSHDPSPPIEREFVLAPAWRALKSRLGGVFQKRRPIVDEQEFSSTARIFEPSLSRAPERGDAVRVQAQPAQWHQAEGTAAINRFEPSLSPDARVIQPNAEIPERREHHATGLEKAFAYEELAATQDPAAVEEPAVSVAEEDFAQAHSDIPPSSAVQAEAIPVARRTDEGFVEEAASTPVSHVRSQAPAEEVPSLQQTAALLPEPAALTPVVMASPLSPVSPAPIASVPNSKIVAAAVRLDTWKNSLKSNLNQWQASLANKRVLKRRNAQQELFFPVSRGSERDHVWAQTTVAAAAIAIAFLMGWIVANSRRPASAADQAIVPSETRGAAVATGVPGGSAVTYGTTPKPSGVTVQAGGATVQAGGVTLLPNAGHTASIPIQVQTPKPSPVHSSGRVATKSGGHLRRSIDGNNDGAEVVVHRYQVKNLARAEDKRQTAQLKKYSDTN